MQMNVVRATPAKKSSKAYNDQSVDYGDNDYQASRQQNGFPAGGLRESVPKFESAMG